MALLLIKATVKSCFGPFESKYTWLPVHVSLKASSQSISAKSGQTGADTQKNIIVHKEHTESQPVFPPLDVKETKVQGKRVKQPQN